MPDDRSDVSNISVTTRREKTGRSKQKNTNTISLEERRKADLMDVRCLLLCIAMLGRVNGVSRRGHPFSHYFNPSLPRSRSKTTRLLKVS